jgi:hypothetical protein
MPNAIALNALPSTTAITNLLVKDRLS